MICLRCGHCCQYYCVVLPDATIHAPDAHDGTGEDCKFLTWDKEGKAVCTIHGQMAHPVIAGVEHEIPWEETPCGQHTQVEQGNTPCRMGEYILKLKTGGQNGTDQETTEGAV